MRSVWTVVRREFLTRVKTKAFILSTLLVPIFLLGVIVVPAWLQVRNERAERNLGIVDDTGVLYELLAPRMERIGYSVRLMEEDDADPAALDALVSSGELGGYLLLDDATLSRGFATFRGVEGPSPIRRFTLAQALTQSALEARLGGGGADVDALLSGGELEVELLDATADESQREVALGLAFLGAFLLYFVLLIYGSQIMRSVLEEKTGRIVEIIISSMEPWELMLGKVLGVGAVGLLQVAVWVASAILIMTMGLPALVGFLPDLENLASLGALLPGAGLAAFFMTCFVLGYFIYASMFAAVGAMCSSDEEAQQAVFPVMLLIIVPFLMMMPILDRPDTPLAVWMSLVPFFSPILMFARATAGSPALWEVGLSILLMIMTVLGVAWLAGRIYRVGILMQGKRPNLPELWKWVRQS